MNSDVKFIDKNKNTEVVNRIFFRVPIYGGLKTKKKSNHNLWKCLGPLTAMSAYENVKAEFVWGLKRGVKQGGHKENCLLMSMKTASTALTSLFQAHSQWGRLKGWRPGRRWLPNNPTLTTSEPDMCPQSNQNQQLVRGLKKFIILTACRSKLEHRWWESVDTLLWQMSNDHKIDAHYLQTKAACPCQPITWSMATIFHYSIICCCHLYVLTITPSNNPEKINSCFLFFLVSVCCSAGCQRSITNSLFSCSMHGQTFRYKLHVFQFWLGGCTLNAKCCWESHAQNISVHKYPKQWSNSRQKFYSYGNAHVQLLKPDLWFHYKR